MAKQLFVNLAVKDLKKAIDFYTKLGFKFNPKFTNDDATCMIINDNSFAMLLVEPFFKSFLKKEIADTKNSAECILAFSLDSKKEVDEFADKALAAGATKSNDPSDQGFMYSRSFQDLDGHLWEAFYMDPAAA